MYDQSMITNNTNIYKNIDLHVFYENDMHNVIIHVYFKMVLFNCLKLGKRIEIMELQFKILCTIKNHNHPLVDLK